MCNGKQNYQNQKLRKRLERKKPLNFSKKKIKVFLDLFNDVCLLFKTAKRLILNQGKDPYVICDLNF